jgi:PBP1b-binding outer membrane lipoprotein LpoB
MKKILSLIFITLTLSSCSEETSVSRTYFYDGNKLHERLTSSNSLENALATGYILGVADAAFSDCNLTKVTGGQLSDTVKIYLKNNPEVRQYGASSLVEKIVKEKYNCK